MNEVRFQKFLNAHGFVERPDLSSIDGPMGNSISAFSSGAFHLRKVVDRGQRFLDVRSSDKSEWLDVFEAIKAVDPDFSPKTGSFDEAVTQLAVYYPKLVMTSNEHFL